VRKLPTGLDGGLVGDARVEVDEGEGTALGMRVLEERQGERGGPGVLRALHRAALSRRRTIGPRRVSVPESWYWRTWRSRSARMRSSRRRGCESFASSAGRILVGSMLHALAALARGDALHPAGEKGDAEEARIAPQTRGEGAHAGAVMGSAPLCSGPRGIPEGDHGEAPGDLSELVHGAGGDGAGRGERTAEVIGAGAGWSGGRRCLGGGCR
jgi:hypothetical protein